MGCSVGCFGFEDTGVSTAQVLALGGSFASSCSWGYKVHASFSDLGFRVWALGFSSEAQKNRA